MNKKTLYQHAKELMIVIVEQLLELAEVTQMFTTPPSEIWRDTTTSIMLLGGLGYHTDELPKYEDRENAWFARSAIPFSIERAATSLLYLNLQPFIDSLIESAYAATDNFRQISADWVYRNPHLLPVMMHVAGTFSKRELAREIGSVSDTRISRPASERLTKMLQSLNKEVLARPDQVRGRMKATTEGIVRDLVGRILLEKFVESALRKENVPFRRESEYESLSGVVYDFRADFVIPDELEPKAFVEVRKSSSGHASLYAKDKMFSAINWKGHHQKCLGIIVVDGPWTTSALDVMARVFDYVIPVLRAGEVARKIRDYLDGDESILRWLIQFRIEPNKRA